MAHPVRFHPKVHSNQHSRSIASESSVTMSEGVDVGSGISSDSGMIGTKSFRNAPADEKDMESNCEERGDDTSSGGGIEGSLYNSGHRPLPSGVSDKSSTTTVNTDAVIGADASSSTAHAIGTVASGSSTSHAGGVAAGYREAKHIHGPLPIKDDCFRGVGGTEITGNGIADQTRAPHINQHQQASPQQVQLQASHPDADTSSINTIASTQTVTSTGSAATTASATTTASNFSIQGVRTKLKSQAKLTIQNIVQSSGISQSPMVEQRWDPPIHVNPAVLRRNSVIPLDHLQRIQTFSVQTDAFANSVIPETGEGATANGSTKCISGARDHPPVSRLRSYAKANDVLSFAGCVVDMYIGWRARGQIEMATGIDRVGVYRRLAHNYSHDIPVNLRHLVLEILDSEWKVSYGFILT